MTKQRLSLVLPERSADRLEALKVRTDASSITEVVKGALLTYEALVEHLSNGVVFSGRRPNGEIFDVEFMIDVEKKHPVLSLVSRASA